MPFVFTSRAEGDLARSSIDVDARRRTIVDLPWVTAKQVHGATVHVVDGPAEREGDALVTTMPGVALAVQVADCAPIALESDVAIGVVHAGWRGLLAGVVDRAVDTMRELGAKEIRAVLGPCIHAECYEFGIDDLDAIAQALGPSVRATTSWGTPALDVPAAVRAVLPDVVDESVCTACAADRYWSHRARGERERQAVVAWM